MKFTPKDSISESSSSSPSPINDQTTINATIRTEKTTTLNTPKSQAQIIEEKQRKLSRAVERASAGKSVSEDSKELVPFSEEELQRRTMEAEEASAGMVVKDGAGYKTAPAKLALDGQLRAIELVELDGLNPKQAAEVMGCDDKTIRQAVQNRMFHLAKFKDVPSYIKGAGVAALRVAAHALYTDRGAPSTQSGTIQ